MKGSLIQFNIDTRKTVLSSKSLFYKTENFIAMTKYVTNVDSILTKLCEGILLNLNSILHNEKTVRNDVECFKIYTSDSGYVFYFKFGYQINEGLNAHDIIFFEFDNKNDLRVMATTLTDMKINIIKDKRLVKYQDFNKLYVISNVSNVNLPRLSPEQKELVETIDKNVLVQGVAGSGKTNICIDKIIFTACKNYSGKVLYTTFSRGLLADTKLKVENYKRDLVEMLNAYKSKAIIFLDDDHTRALENRLGIYFFSDDDNQIFDKIQKIVDYLTNKVDYLLIEDIYRLKFGWDFKFVDENYFINNYCKNLSNYQIEKCFSRLSQYSKEVIYKEIFGMISGYCNLSDTSKILSLNEYVVSRKNSFSRQICENIYQIALDYNKHCSANNLVDNNIASRKILKNVTKDFEYSLSIIDEVQDYTQINLNLFKKLSLKLFCVGDALQMINPSYFNFGYLKNILYEKDVTDVKELKSNYRNTLKIATIIDNLGEVNKAVFGTHNFVLHGEAIDNGIKSTAVFVKESDFVHKVASSHFDNFTFVVSSVKEKKELQKILTNQEVLTVSEIKGLERNTIVAYNLLSSNLDKWQTLERHKVNHKEADENSVYRYYYNLFYVGVSRAKQNIFIVENSTINQFVDFFETNFTSITSSDAIKQLKDIVSQVEFTQQEVMERVSEFLKMGQYDNARFTAMKMSDDILRNNSITTIGIYEDLIQHGKYREAGIKFWEYGLIDEARKQFTLSGDNLLIDLMDKCTAKDDTALSIDIINYYEDVGDNEFAKNFILETLKNDVKILRNNFREIQDNFNKGGVYGK